MEYKIIRDKNLCHSGVKGQKWGIRRYQNEDGSLTAEGKERYGDQRGWEARQMYKKGTISKSEMKKLTKSDGIYGKVRTVATLGLGGRRVSEFRQRHKKGDIAAGVALTTIGSMASAALTSKALTGRVSLGAVTISGLLGGAAKATVSGAAGSALNGLVLDRSFNKKTGTKKGGKAFNNYGEMFKKEGKTWKGQFTRS